MVVLPRFGPIGFVRLISKSEGAEIVVVIGERSQWGNGYGVQSVKKAVRKVIYDWREDTVIAKIHKENDRSQHVFEKVGFTPQKEFFEQIKYVFEYE